MSIIFINKNNFSLVMSTPVMETPPPYMPTAGVFYSGYLRIVGVDDPAATVTGTLGLSVYGIKSPERVAETGRAYDRFPESILVEINRARDGTEPRDPDLVDAITRANAGETIEGSIADCLREWHERVNTGAPGTQEKPPYWDFLASTWPNIKPEPQPRTP